MTFSEKLKQAMQELHLNQRQVCGMTGKSKGSVSQYLSGKQIPSEDVQAAIAVALGLEENYFSKDEGTVITVRQSQYGDVFGKVNNRDVAKIMHVHTNTIAEGLQQGVFPWGYAIKKGVSKKTGKPTYSYIINAKRFAEIEGVVI